MATATQDTKAQDSNKPDLSKADAHAKSLALAAKVANLSKEELMDLIIKGATDPKVFEALRTLNTAEDTKRQEKKKSVLKLVEELNTHGITFIDLKEAGAQVPDLDKLFDENTIKLVAAKYFSGAKTAGTSKPKTDGATDGTPKESKKLMIALPSNGKRPAGYGKGDTLGTYTKPAFKELFTQHGDKFESVMEGHRTEEGKVYYATPEGKKEWAALIEHIKTKKVAPTK